MKGLQHPRNKVAFSSIAILFLLFCSCLFVFTACGGDDEEPVASTSTNSNRNNASSNAALAGLEFPHVTATDRVLVHYTSDNRFFNSINYCTVYSDSRKLPRYSCYKMYSSISVQNTSRWTAGQGEYQYPEDASIPTSYRLQNSNDPFWNSGYDHGHLIPSADRLSSREANQQTFYLSNMMPQVNGFNAKVWANMEAQVRTWNRDTFRDTLYVCTGGTIDSDDDIIKYIGSSAAGNQIPVPKYFWKAVLCKNASGYKALGFWIEHASSDDNALKKYVVNIDWLERRTGIDFFCNLPDEIENVIEAVPVENVAKSFGFN